MYTGLLYFSSLFLVLSTASTPEKRMTNERMNILGGHLEVCSNAPLTGYKRDGFCATCASDPGNHTVCALITQPFLDFTKSRGNDLQTPREEFGFPGLKPGDKWCLCAGRFYEAHKAGCAPKIVGEATAKEAADEVPKEVLLSYVLDPK